MMVLYLIDETQPDNALNIPSFRLLLKNLA